MQWLRQHVGKSGYGKSSVYLFYRTDDNTPWSEASKSPHVPQNGDVVWEWFCPELPEFSIEEEERGLIVFSEASDLPRMEPEKTAGWAFTLTADFQVDLSNVYKLHWPAGTPVFRGAGDKRPQPSWESIQAWGHLKSILFKEALGGEGGLEKWVDIRLQNIKDDLAKVKKDWSTIQSQIQVDIPSPDLSDSILIREATVPELDKLLAYDIISIDVFDTCLFRKLSWPEEIFTLAGSHGKLHVPFSEARKSIENLLREAHLSKGTREDTTLSEIYDTLKEHLKWSKEETEWRRNIELELEKKFIFPSIHIRNLINALVLQGKRIIYTSEMYLPESVIRELLESNGFPIKDIPVFLSGDSGLSKGSGNLFKKVQQQYPAQSIVHIGDNPVSDLSVPKSFGFNVKKAVAEKSCYKDALSNALHVIHTRWPYEGHGWEADGYNILGPLCVAWINDILNKSRENGVNKIYFLSRDGWFPFQVFKKLEDQWGLSEKGHYVYASRQSWNLSALNEIRSVDWEFLLKPAPGLTVRKVFERAGISIEDNAELARSLGIGSPDEIICHHGGFINSSMHDQLYSAFCTRIDDLLAHQRPLSDRMRSYLNSTEIFERGSAMVDLGWTGSSFRSLRRLAMKEMDTLPFYFGIWAKDQKEQEGELPEISFLSGPKALQREHMLKGGVALLEQLMGAPEPSVKDVGLSGDNWYPIFDTELECDKRFKQIAPLLEKGMWDFVTRLCDFIGNPIRANGMDYIEKLLNDWIWNPTVDQMQRWGSTSHMEGWANGREMTLLPKKEYIDSVPEPKLLQYTAWKGAFRPYLNYTFSSKK